MQLIESAQAKINLYLRILGRREDGFHQIETVMQTLQLADQVILRDRPCGISLQCDAPELSAGPDNLAWRAAALLAEAFPGRGVSITLNKRIPWQAGLGGGSSDAAAVLRGLNKLWRLQLSAADLTGFAAKLGSDVPFFLRGGTAVARGRGEEITPLSACPDVDVALLVPPFGLATAAVYHDWRPFTVTPPAWTALLQALADRDRALTAQLLFNDLEAPAFGLQPELASLRARLLRAGLPTLLSGSGSCLFALLFREDDSSRLRDLVPAPYRLIFTRFSPLLTLESAGEGWTNAEI